MPVSRSNRREVPPLSAGNFTLRRDDNNRRVNNYAYHQSVVVNTSGDDVGAATVSSSSPLLTSPAAAKREGGGGTGKGESGVVDVAPGATAAAAAALGGTTTSFDDHGGIPLLLQSPYQQKKVAQQTGQLPQDGDGEMDGDGSSPFTSKLYVDECSDDNSGETRGRRQSGGGGGGAASPSSLSHRGSGRGGVQRPSSPPFVSLPLTPPRRSTFHQHQPPHPNLTTIPPSAPLAAAPPAASRRRLSTLNSPSRQHVTNSGKRGAGEEKNTAAPGGDVLVVNSSSFATPLRQHPRMNSVSGTAASASTYLSLQGSAGLATCSPRVPAPPRRPTDVQLQHIKTTAANSRGQCFRTFDRDTGTLTHHSFDSFPSVVSLTRSQYKDHITDPEMMSQARLHVAKLSLDQQVRLAVAGIRRHHAVSSTKRKHAEVFGKSNNEDRMNAMLNIEVDDLISHLGKETERLSRMRIERAAADEHLMNLARIEAKRKVAVLEEKLLPDALPLVDLLRLQLDACRRIPEPPRQMLPPDPPKSKTVSTSIGNARRVVGTAIRIAGAVGTNPSYTTNNKLHSHNSNTKHTHLSNGHHLTNSVGGTVVATPVDNLSASSNTRIGPPPHHHTNNTNSGSSRKSVMTTSSH